MTHDRSAPMETVTQAEERKPKPPARRGRPVGDREAKRAELLKAAVSVLAEEGYAGTSMRKVAQRAGCTTGAVTYYFANKEAMVAAVTEHLFDQFDTLLEFDGVEQRFARWLEWAGTDSDLWLAQFQLLALARHEPAFAAIFQRRYAHYRRTLASSLAKGQKEGTIRSDIPADILADQLAGMADGWMTMLPIEPERFKPKRIKALLDAVNVLIAPPGSESR